MAEPVKDTDPPARSSFWQPPEERDVVPKSSDKWTQEEIEIANSWKDWVEKNGLPLAEYRPF